MPLQYVPIKAIGCFLDYTYCASKNCTNQCGSKMSKEIEDAINKITYANVAYSYFCDEE